jgi:osmotically-inducible protein OsmY
VEFGCIDLAGEVVWNHQRNAAEQAVRNLVGVVNVNSSISIMPETLPEQVKQKVQAALQRQATADVRSIHIVVSGGQVTLTGYAASWQAIEDAANAAWAVPGVTEVSDRVKVSIKSPTSL